MYFLFFNNSQDLHQSAEQAVKDYKYKDDLDLNDVDYTNVNEMDGLLNETEYSTHFKQNIYKANSGVQIPIEIYEGCKFVFRFYDI